MTISSPEENKAELERFHAKLHRAQLDMFNARSAELKALGVPFFGTRSQLIVRSEEQNSRASADDSQMEHAGKITDQRLLELQERMIQHLEDLYKD
ncbi:hypothetical protein B0A49_10998 [Cryomyces minteri]|uniref:Uncharacterized protein n=1 Tax=Cryomyces minteri TaxID=331657 RepID=A0A4V5NC73_9PEZI|nr:hypothetical protein B0A49_10998 [Cryomyces minteri]